MNFNFIFRFLIALLLAHRFSADEFFNKIENLWLMCIYLEYQIFDGMNPHLSPNIATIVLGDMVVEAYKHIWDRDVESDSDGDDGGVGVGCVAIKRGMKAVTRMMVNFDKYVEKETTKMKARLDRCVNHLAQRGGRDNTIFVRIVSNADKGLDNLLQFGRDLVKKITYYPEYDLDKDFYIPLIQATLTPIATKDGLVNDINIGHKEAGYWNKKILIDKYPFWMRKNILTIQELLNEEFFSELKFNSTGRRPYWQFIMMVPPGFYAIIQFCQWSKHLGWGQKFRMRYKLEDEVGFAKLMEWVNNLLNPPEDEICF